MRGEPLADASKAARRFEDILVILEPEIHEGEGQNEQNAHRYWVGTQIFRQRLKRSVNFAHRLLRQYR